MGDTITFTDSVVYFSIGFAIGFLVGEIIHMRGKNKRHNRRA